ncbi:MAG TPA: hypothetical protein PKH94_03235 [Bacteroidales bacterium]|nr:hypothetical protein [Bacteroidales bacterium]HNS46229.1 hypothetical protein [Bacteroidales bacterium]
MTTFHWVFLTCTGVCFLVCLYHFVRSLFLTRPREYAKARGKVFPAVAYSFTKAMSPSRKESAYLHLPTYVSGLVYHLGTFLSLFLVFLFFFNVYPTLPWSAIFAGALSISFLAGWFILIKRIIKKELRQLSNPDDFISNALVTAFQGFVVLTLLINSLTPALLICASVLMLYIPIGKLKHVVYFFTSRVYLAIFFGRRGAWPVKEERS